MQRTIIFSGCLRQSASGPIFLKWSSEMTDKVLFALTLVSALGCGLNAGVFFAFSSFVMKALVRLPAAQGIAAMQSINVTAISPAFMTALFGTAVACLVLVISAAASWQRPGAVFLLAGGLVYLLGTILVTIACNVPRNDALAAVEPTSSDGPAVWARFADRWTAWNHVRAGAALAAAASLTLALVSD
jgi:uncharacterized membrane protein